MHFTIDYLALGLLVGAGFLLNFLKRHFFAKTPSPSLAFSRLKDLHLPSWRSRFASYPLYLHLAALACFMLAFCDPHFLWPYSSKDQKQALPFHEEPTEGIAIYLALDQSGSMAESVKADGESISKINLLKRVTKQFILDHPSDLIGLVSFARVPRVLVPLTLDQSTLLHQLDQIQIVKKPDEDGTAIGYAIFKTANLIAATRHFAEESSQEGKSPYTIKSAILIVVTDGFQDPSRLDQGNRLRTIELDDAAAYAKSQNIRVYVINIDPILASSDYAPHRRQLQSITALTGGKFYLVSDNQGLADIYADINHLEKGTILPEVTVKAHHDQIPEVRFSLYPFLIGLGLLFLFMALFLDSFIFRKVP